MREKKWTKGPWRRDPISPRQISAPNGRSIGRAHLSVGGDAEPFANACLMEAAPELVDALEALLSEVETSILYDDTVVYTKTMRARAALAKAYGEGE